ncbi:MAG: succinate--CoA ligase subunit alpha [Candidatus Neomarinimicrobiota bacterium]|jgi:succinyl-CoA synthetase alpha subunit|nr:succinate--CoA ligase subunit alpha [Candidatus Neomarinimicrobiota bacterium]GIS42476.1 MAG: succinate--CoA ligase [ADP-forming] subunit alpha [Candidatus Neomarinimicrobiota bacterium]|tara:strand:+ start:753 stop:1634 length:882 start_codon:yes stop_codon:yes gene_type:complete
MSILLNKDTTILVQGITGSEGLFHTEQMLQYNAKVLCGVTPGKGGESVTEQNLPVFNSIEQAKEKFDINATAIFVPPKFAASAIMEAIEQDIELIVCISEGIPVRDMITVKNMLDKSSSTLIGPNCPGIITAEESKIGITPGFICKKGSIGIVSRSGTLTYEAIDQVVNVGLGLTTAVGIGGDPVIGSSMIDILKHFNDDNETQGVVMIGEIGGNMENEAGEWIKDNMEKPVVSFIAGQTAPKGKRMGHAGAIISEGSETAEAKIKILKECGVTISNTVSEIGNTMKKIMGEI